MAILVKVGGGSGKKEETDVTQYIPEMTSNTTPKGVATCSNGTAWYSLTSTGANSTGTAYQKDGWIQYLFDEPHYIGKVTFEAQIDIADRYFQGKVVCIDGDGNEVDLSSWGTYSYTSGTWYSIVASSSENIYAYGIKIYMYRYVGNGSSNYTSIRKIRAYNVVSNYLYKDGTQNVAWEKNGSTYTDASSWSQLSLSDVSNGVKSADMSSNYQMWTYNTVNTVDITDYSTFKFVYNNTTYSVDISSYVGQVYISMVGFHINANHFGMILSSIKTDINDNTKSCILQSFQLQTNDIVSVVISRMWLEK